MSGTVAVAAKSYRVVPFKCDFCHKEFVLGMIIVKLLDDSNSAYLAHRSCVPKGAKE